MPTYIQGLADSVQHLVTAAVSSATGNGVSPIVLTTSAPHLMSSGDRVFVQGVGGNTAANSPQNRPWVIDVVANNQISLRGSTGNGAYTSGGLAIDTSLQTPFQVLLDTDPDTAAGRNVSLEALADRSQYLARSLAPNGLTLINQYQASVSDDASGSWSNTTVSNDASWHQATNAIFSTILSAAGLAGWATSPAPVCDAGDVFDVAFIGSINLAGSSGAVALTRAKLLYKLSGFDSNNFTFSTYTGGLIGGAQSYEQQSTGITQIVMPCHLRSVIQVPVLVSTAASIATAVAGISTITGLAGMSAATVGNYLNIGGAATAANNGEFLVTAFVSSSSVKIANPLATTDANNGAILTSANAQQFDFSVQLFNGGAAPIGVNFIGDYQVIVNHYRPSVALGRV